LVFVFETVDAVNAVKPSPGAGLAAHGLEQSERQPPAVEWRRRHLAAAGCCLAEAVLFILLAVLCFVVVAVIFNIVVGIFVVVVIVVDIFFLGFSVLISLGSDSYARPHMWS
jgi:hypothetical protein